MSRRNRKRTQFDSKGDLLTISNHSEEPDNISIRMLYKEQPKTLKSKLEALKILKNKHFLKNPKLKNSMKLSKKSHYLGPVGKPGYKYRSASKSLSQKWTNKGQLFSKSLNEIEVEESSEKESGYVRPWDTKPQNLLNTFSTNFETEISLEDSINDMKHFAESSSGRGKNASKEGLSDTSRHLMVTVGVQTGLENEKLAKKVKKGKRRKLKATGAGRGKGAGRRRRRRLMRGKRHREMLQDDQNCYVRPKNSFRGSSYRARVFDSKSLELVRSLLPELNGMRIRRRNPRKYAQIPDFDYKTFEEIKQSSDYNLANERNNHAKSDHERDKQSSFNSLTAEIRVFEQQYINTSQKENFALDNRIGRKLRARGLKGAYSYDDVNDFEDFGFLKVKNIFEDLRKKAQKVRSKSLYEASKAKKKRRDADKHGRNLAASKKLAELNLVNFQKNSETFTRLEKGDIRTRPFKAVPSYLRGLRAAKELNLKKYKFHEKLVKKMFVPALKKQIYVVQTQTAQRCRLDSGLNNPISKLDNTLYKGFYVKKNYPRLSNQASKALIDVGVDLSKPQKDSETFNIIENQKPKKVKNIHTNPPKTPSRTHADLTKELSDFVFNQEKGRPPRQKICQKWPPGNETALEGLGDEPELLGGIKAHGLPVWRNPLQLRKKERNLRKRLSMTCGADLSKRASAQRYWDRLRSGELDLSVSEGFEAAFNNRHVSYY